MDLVAGALGELEEEPLQAAGPAGAELTQRDARGERDVADLLGGCVGHQRAVVGGRDLDREAAQRAAQRVIVGGAHAGHGLLADELVARALGDDRAVGDDHEPVGDRLDLVEQVGGEQHGAPTAGEVTQQSAHPAHPLGIQAVGRLVEDQQLRVAEQGVGDPQPLAHAERVLADALARRGLVEPDELQHLVHARVGNAEQLRGAGEGLPAAAAAVGGGGVDQDAHVPARVGDLGERPPEQRRASRGRVREAAEHLQGRRLPGAVRSEEAGHGAGRAGEGHVLDGRTGAVALGEGLGFDHGSSIASCVCPHQGRRSRSAPPTVCARIDLSRWSRHAGGPTVALMASNSGAGRLHRGRRGRRARDRPDEPAQAHAHLPRWQRAILPAMLGADRTDRGEREGVEVKRSLRDWLVDILLFVGALVIGGGGVWNDHQVGVSTPLVILDAAMIAPTVGALWVRRRHPFAVGLIAIVGAAVSNGAGGAALVAMFSAAIYCRPRRVGGLFALALTSAAITPLIYENHGSYASHDLVLGLLGTIIATAFGAFVRARRELVLSLHERARTLQEEQALRISEARQAERTRIAREMHDVLAHRISLLAVHAGALEFHPDAPPEEIARAAAVIRESARAAQEELREVIGVLRTEPAVPPPSVQPTDPGRPLEPPQPTIEDLGPLVEESRATGMEVRLATALDPPRLPPTLGRTVYRVVQEGLTNVRKHAPDHVVTVTVVGGRHGGVRVSVVNQPAVGRAGEADVPDHVGSGTGLIGLGERVALAGGRLESGPLPGGGFRLSATLPWQSEAAV